MSAFMVSNHLMQKVVTAVLQNTDHFATIQTFRGQIVDDLPSDAQCQAAEDIGKRLFGMNIAAIKARYGFLPQRPVFNSPAGPRQPQSSSLRQFVACSTNPARAPCPTVASTAN